MANGKAGTRSSSDDDVGAMQAMRPYTMLVLGMLTLGYALNFLDRQIINILAESIKRDLAISDTQLGLLTGTAFGLFYSILGIPIARLADRTKRVNVPACRE